MWHMSYERNNSTLPHSNMQVLEEETLRLMWHESAAKQRPMNGGARMNNIDLA